MWVMLQSIQRRYMDARFEFNKDGKPVTDNDGCFNVVWGILDRRTIAQFKDGDEDRMNELVKQFGHK